MNKTQYQNLVIALVAFSICLGLAVHDAWAAGSVIADVLQPESEGLAELFNEDLAKAIGIAAAIAAIIFAIMKQWFGAIVTFVVAAICYVGIEQFS